MCVCVQTAELTDHQWLYNLVWWERRRRRRRRRREEERGGEQTKAEKTENWRERERDVMMRKHPFFFFLLSFPIFFSVSV